MQCGCSCSEHAPKPKQVNVGDTNKAYYPYAEDFLIGGMSCEECERNVENTLTALEGTWANVDLNQKTAHALSKAPIDRDACARAIRDAGYPIRCPWRLVAALALLHAF